YRKALMDAAGDKLKIDFIDSWHDNPLLVHAFAVKLKQLLEQTNAQSNGKVAILFTAHSVPERTVAPQADGRPGDPYAEQCRNTAALIAAECGLAQDGWSFAFQSQGMSGGPWIGPTVEDTLTRLAESGAQTVVLQTIGFVCD